MRTMQITFFWEPLPWERKRDRGQRLATWPDVPRVGDLVNLIIQNEDSQPFNKGTMITFRVSQVLWNADGLDGSQVHVSLESAGLPSCGV
jgi:hypothetical protein